jgi:hypothetical protein
MIGGLFFPVLAHLLYDFHWQGAFIAENKGKYPFLLFVHAFTWTMLVYAAFYIRQPQINIIHFNLLLWSHWLCDYWKSHQPKDEEHFWYIYIDQLVHFASIALVWLMLKL